MIICLLLAGAAVWLAYGPITAAKEYAEQQAACITRRRIACEREKEQLEREKEERQLEREKERQLEREPKAAASHIPQANNLAAPMAIRAPSRIVDVDVTVPVNMQTTDVLV